jgi:hypothetical protein
MPPMMTKMNAITMLGDTLHPNFHQRMQHGRNEPFLLYTWDILNFVKWSNSKIMPK